MQYTLCQTCISGCDGVVIISMPDIIISSWYCIMACDEIAPDSAECLIRGFINKSSKWGHSEFGWKYWAYFHMKLLLKGFEYFYYK